MKQYNRYTIFGTGIIIFNDTEMAERFQMYGWNVRKFNNKFFGISLFYRSI